MADNTKSIAVTLKLRDSEETRAALIALGAEGKKALDQLTAGSNPATKALEALNVVGGRASSKVAEIAEYGGTLSAAIGKLGPAGAAVGVTIGAVVALGVATKKAAEQIKEIKQAADIAGVSVEAFQRLEFAGKKFSITTDDMADGLKELALRGDEFAVTGVGSAAEAFQRLGYSQTHVNAALKDTPKLLVDVANRMQSLDKASQIRIADELFGGTAGEKFVAMLAQGGDAITALGQKAEQMGYVISGSLIAQSSEMVARFDLASEALGRNFNAALIQCAPLVEGLAAALEHLSVRLRFLRLDWTYLFQETPTPEAIIAEKTAQIEEINRRLAKLATSKTAGLQGAPLHTSILQQSKAQLEADIAALQKEFYSPDTPAATTVRSAPVPDKDAADRAKAIAEMGREVERLDELSAAHLRNADAVKSVEDAMAVDIELRKLKISQDSAEGREVTELIVKKRALEQAIKDRTKAEEDGKAMTEAMRTPQEVYATEIERITELLKAGVISQETYARKASASWDTLAAEGQRVAAQLMTPQETYAKQMADYDRMLAQGTITQETYGRATTKAFKDMNDQIYNSSELTRGLGDAASGFFKTAIADSGKLGNAFESLGMKIADMILELTVFNQMKSGIGSLLGGASGSIFSSVFGSGVSASPGYTVATGAVTGVPGFAEGGSFAGGLRIVGEKGPELEATGPSRIWTASQTRQMLGGAAQSSGPSAVYHIDARGADQAGLARLEAMITSLNGSIEGRAVGAVTDAVRRGGQTAKVIRGR